MCTGSRARNCYRVFDLREGEKARLRRPHMYSANHATKSGEGGGVI